MPPKVEPEPTEGGGDEDEGKTTGCCCCKGKVAPDGPVEVNPDYWAEKRNCWSHDPCFCILFLAYWVGMIVVLSVAASNGNGNGIESLLYGKDWQGSTCGVANSQHEDWTGVADADGNFAGFDEIDLTTKPKLYFPLEGQQMPPPADLSEVTLYGICHDECPSELGRFEFDCACLNPNLSAWKRLQLNCEDAGEDLSSAPDVPRVMAAADEAACTAAGGTWGYPSKADASGPDTALSQVCLTEQGARFGTRFPTAGYTQYGVSHDCVCEYGDTACWDVTYPTKEVMYRCVPCEDPTQPDCQPPVSQSTKCVDVVQGEPVTLDEAACTAAGGGINWCSGDGTCCSTACVANNCPTGPPTSVLDKYPVPGNVNCPAGTRKYVLSTVEAQEVPDNVIGDAVSGGMATVTQYINDLFACQSVILVCGAVIAVGISGFWVGFLKYCAGPLVWITILAVLSLLAMLTVVGLSKSGQMNEASDLLVAEVSLGSTNITGFLGIPLAPEEERWIWSLMWIFGGIAFFVALIMLCMKVNKIRQATAVIKEASNALKDMQLMLVFPFLPFILTLVIFLYFIIGASFIWTAEGITMAQVTSEVTTAAAATTGTNSTITAPGSGEDIVFYMFWYHLFGKPAIFLSLTACSLADRK